MFLTEKKPKPAAISPAGSNPLNIHPYILYAFFFYFLHILVFIYRLNKPIPITGRVYVLYYSVIFYTACFYWTKVTVLLAKKEKATIAPLS